MGGIGGMIDFSKRLFTDEAAAVLRELRHRGGRREGVFSAPGAMLCSTSDCRAQPFCRRVGAYSYVCAADGSITNAAELRRSLMLRGHSFQTEDDAELLIMAYFEWGAAFCERLCGDFAVALYDGRERKLVLARDALGVRPLFYSRPGEAFIFGSEIKALLTAVPARMNREGLMTLFALSPACPPGKTLFADVSELPPGHCLTLCPTGRTLNRCFELRPTEHTQSAAETAQDVRRMVTERLIACLPESGGCAAFLSGGLDSGILCVLAAYELAQRGRLLRTYSIHYKDNSRYFKSNYYQSGEDDEYIDLLRRTISCEHTRIVLDPEQVAGALCEAMRARDMPGMADIDSSLLLACREIGEGTVLSGECADELFCGYPWFAREDLMQGEFFPWSGSMSLRRSLLSPAFASLPIEDYVRAYRSASRPKNEADTDELRRELFRTNLAWFGSTLLTRKDRMSHAAGVCARLPFADGALAQYAYGIPWDMKYLRGREKGILREAFRDMLPPQIYARKKTPYPKTCHPIYHETVCARLREILHDPASRLTDIVSRRRAEALAASGDPGGEPWFGQLMTRPQMVAFLIQLDAWLRDYCVRLDV